MKTILRIVLSFFAFAPISQTNAQMPIEKRVYKIDNTIFETFINAGINDKTKINTTNFKAFKNLRDTSCYCLPDSIYISYYTQLNGVQRFTYNLDGNITNVLNQDWNGSGPIWKNNTFYTLSYDANGNMLNKLQQIWNSTSSIWVNSTQEIYTYDSIGRITSNLPQNWDTASTSWINYTRYINFNWDSNGNNLGYIQQFWNDTLFAWENSFKYINSYDANGNSLVNLRQNWVDSTATWVNYRQNVYTWDSLSNNTSWAEQWWMPNTNMWATGFHSTQANTYDNDGFLVSMLYTYTAGNVTQHQYTFTNDANGRILHSLGLWLNGGNWVNEFQATYTYDFNGNETSYLSQNWYINYWENTLLNTHSYDTCGNLLTETRKAGNGPLESYQYFYPLSCTTAYQGLNNLEHQLEIKLFPNPTQNEINIEHNNQIIKTISIYNSLGVKVLRLAHLKSNKQTIDVSELKNGVYFVDIIFGNDTREVKKFVKN
jgi:hypothetical protein